MNIGERIYNARKNAGLTQKQLCEDKITRNMLSAIENGRAAPSLDTLMHIAEHLDVPISYLLGETDMNSIKKNTVINSIKLAYREKRYIDCISMIEKSGIEDDELILILAFSYFEVGRHSLFSGTLITAYKQLNLAKEYSEKTIYDTSRITAVLPMYIAVAKNIQSPLLELDVSELEHSQFTDSYEFYKYISLDTEYAYTNPLFANHMKAKKLIRAREYANAINVLKELENDKRSDTYNAYAYFSIYTDIESCYKQMADFENAYRYSNKRMSMLEGFKT